LKRIEDDDDFMLEWLAPHEGPNYRIGTDVIIMTEPEDLKYVKESFKNGLIWPHRKSSKNLLRNRLNSRISNCNRFLNLKSEKSNSKLRNSYVIDDFE